MPVVADRDYTVRVRRRDDAEAHTYVMEALAAPDLGPPPQKGVVRVTRIVASWRVEPSGTGPA